MKNTHVYVFLLLIISAQSFSQKSFAPVNKNASPEAKALLEYLYSISGKKIISGHHNYSRKL